MILIHHVVCTLCYTRVQLIKLSDDSSSIEAASTELEKNTEYLVLGSKHKPPWQGMYLW